MSTPRASSDDFLTISPRIRVLPIIHGSGDFAVQVREELLSRPYDCVAVPLPPSFQEEVEAAVDRLPAISVVVQVDAESDDDDETEGEPGFSYVPIDPCQGVIAALRTARGERIAREFIDLETPRFVSVTGTFPDPYALKRGQPRAIRRGGPGGGPASAGRSGDPADHLDGGAAPRAGIAVSPRSSSSARSSTGPGSAMPTGAGSSLPSPSRSSRRSRPSPSIPGR